MDITVNKRIEKIWDGFPCPSNRIRKWITLFFCMLLIWTFVFIVAPWIEKLPFVKPLADFIEESGIDASALYYTEIEETSDAELMMRSTMERIKDK